MRLCGKQICRHVPRRSTDAHFDRNRFGQVWTKIDKVWIWQHSFLMHVSLTPTLEKHVRKKVDSGLYNNASEVVREALRLMIEQETGLNWLRTEAALGFAQLEAGEHEELNREQFLKRVTKRRAA
jgi:antitoxin ParD1/3/4